MTLQPLDTPQKLAHYLTDNARLQAHLTTFLALKTDAERQIVEKNFWLSVTSLSKNEQNDLIEAKKKVAQRMLDRSSSLFLFFKEEKEALAVLA